MTRVLVAVSVLVLLGIIVAGWSAPNASLGRITPLDTSPFGILRSAGYLFFAFAGYARIATLGEEVRDPERTIPRAIPVALGMVLVALRRGRRHACSPSSPSTSSPDPTRRCSWSSRPPAPTAWRP